MIALSLFPRVLDATKGLVESSIFDSYNAAKAARARLAASSHEH